ncbi:MAG: low affinity iron permease family protein [Stenotrophomonas sp.]|uniref:low affinity iron permease family protein n=1 Tax=Stenotrophomonas sp. TaxID=69392 RepID=UPI0028ACDE6A|nr:low affinity iron permease family protein [Stenotrophomonas sp.]
MHIVDMFNKLAGKVARSAGSLGAFIVALAVIVVWGATGPLFQFNDTWQLVINTGTTIVTFLMVFLIQHTQNVDSAALQIKLDELIRASKEANNELLNLEELDDARLEEIRRRYEALAETAAAAQAKKSRCMPNDQTPASR